MNKIPISKVQIDDSIIEGVMQVLQSGMLAQGPKVLELEKQFASVSGADHAIAVNNGTTALVLALEVLDLQPGDEVITTPFTFAATLNAIIESGATAIFVDIDDDYLMDMSQVAEKISPRTKAILPVHLFGQMVDMSTLLDVLKNHPHVAIVEDAAQSVGAQFQNRGAGSFGIGCFSMYATKNVGCGEGGMVTTNDAHLAERMRILRNQGMRARYEYVEPGHNYRLTDLHAAVAVPQMNKIEQILSARSKNAAYLQAGLQDFDGLRIPREIPGRRHAWNQFTLGIGKDAPISRDDLINRLTEAGIGTGIYYPRTVFDYECYRNRPDVIISPVPKAESAANSVLSIPVHPTLSDADLAYIVDTMKKLWA